MVVLLTLVGAELEGLRRIYMKVELRRVASVIEMLVIEALLAALNVQLLQRQVVQHYLHSHGTVFDTGAREKMVLVCLIKGCELNLVIVFSVASLSIGLVFGCSKGQNFWLVGLAALINYEVQVHYVLVTLEVVLTSCM